MRKTQISVRLNENVMNIIKDIQENVPFRLNMSQIFEQSIISMVKNTPIQTLQSPNQTIPQNITTNHAEPTQQYTQEIIQKDNLIEELQTKIRNLEEGVTGEIPQEVQETIDFLERSKKLLEENLKEAKTKALEYENLYEYEVTESIKQGHEYAKLYKKYALTKEGQEEINKNLIDNKDYYEKQINNCYNGFCNFYVEDEQTVRSIIRKQIQKGVLNVYDFLCIHIQLYNHGKPVRDLEKMFEVKFHLSDEPMSSLDYEKKFPFKNIYEDDFIELKTQKDIVNQVNKINEARVKYKEMKENPELYYDELDEDQ